MYKLAMGAGENLPWNVLCEDGDISYRLFYYTETGVNAWVSPMQTTYFTFMNPTESITEW